MSTPWSACWCNACTPGAATGATQAHGGPTTPGVLTIAAWHDAAVVATVSLGRDSPAGLLADELYARELGRLRRFERVVCEASRLAVDPDFSSPDLLLALFQTAHACAREHFAASDAVIEVNPRHARFYIQRFGFTQIGEERICSRVGAPAVLLHRSISSAELREQLAA